MNFTPNFYEIQTFIKVSIKKRKKKNFYKSVVCLSTLSLLFNSYPSMEITSITMGFVGKRRVLGKQYLSYNKDTKSKKIKIKKHVVLECDADDDVINPGRRSLILNFHIKSCHVARLRQLGLTTPKTPHHIHPHILFIVFSRTLRLCCFLSFLSCQ